MVERRKPEHRRIMRAFKIGEISAVDSPAQAGARAVLMKCDDPPQVAPPVASLASVERLIRAMDFDEVVEEEASRASVMRIKDVVWSKWHALQRSFETIADDADVTPADKVTQMQESLAQFLNSVRAESEAVTEEITKSITAVPALAELLPTGSEGDSPMNDVEKQQLEDLRKSVADLTAKLEAATAKDVGKKAADLAGELEEVKSNLAEALAKLEKSDAEKAEALVKAAMTDEEKKFCADMPAAEKMKFMRMSHDERAKAMKKSADADPVVYKSEATGEEFRKSDDPRLVRLAEQADRSEKIAKAEREARESAEFAKRADEELKYFSDGVAKRDEKIEVLRAADRMEEGPRAALLKMLEVGGKAIAAAFDTIGHRRESVDKSADAFAKRVSEVQARDGCTKLQAMERAQREFPDEFAAYQGN